MFRKLRKPYPAETTKNYVAYDLETGNAEIVLHNRDLLPRCIKILVKRVIERRTKKH